MINGLHALVFSPEADAVREFFRDVLEWKSEDAGGGWLIFACPPTELAVHPSEESRFGLYLMCDDLASTIEQLKERGVAPTKPVMEEPWAK